MMLDIVLAHADSGLQRKGDDGHDAGVEKNVREDGDRDRRDDEGLG